ncbi:MAG: alpha-hydroxy acid oxidase [Dehalococcoidia bacterium]
MASPTRTPVNLFEFEPLVKDQIDKGDYDYIAGGALDEYTLRRTRSAYDAIALRPRMLAGVAQPDLSVSVLGATASLPVLIAPTGGLTRSSHPQAELEAAKAAAEAGTIMCVTANASFTMEEVTEAAPGPKWFQTYLLDDRDATMHFAGRAEAAGYKAIILTLDTLGVRKRERDIRNDYQRKVSPNYAQLMSGGRPRPAVDPNAKWPYFEWFCSQTKLPVVAKGIMTGEDAALAVEHGASAIDVSNHGARNLDSTLATIEALPEVVKTVRGRIPVLLDGGIRRGADAVKAIALGATAVLIGRPIFWGLAYAGKEGVCMTLDILREEISLTMRSVGKQTVSEIDSSVVTRVPTTPAGA